MAPTRIVATSMGAFIAQELLLSRPELVSKAALLATRGRLDRAREFFRRADRELAASAVQLPPAFDAKMRMLEGFSPSTCNDDRAIADWIDMFTIWPTKPTPGLRRQLDIAPESNRLPAYATITTPALVIGFADDVVVPPHLAREVAESLPHAQYLQIRDAGHLGFLERPEQVNAAILQYFKYGVS